MSRIDQALRRASHALDPGRQPEVFPDVAAGAEETSHLQRYAPEPVEGRRTSAPPARHEPRSRPVIASKVPSTRQLASVDPALQGKLVITREVNAVSVEQYRRLAASLHERQVQTGLKTLMVSSAAPREGKTLTVTNLALTLSESYDRKVLLIDADLRRPSVHAVFGFQNKTGLADLARRGATELALVEVTPRLSILPAGCLDSDAPTSELTSGWLQTAIVAAAAQFDWVLLDTPPVGMMPDAHLIASAVQGVLFVIAAGKTPYDLIRRAIADLGPDRIVGTVLNGVGHHAVTGGEYYQDYYLSGKNRTVGA